MDTIFIKQLKIETIIGVLPIERQFKQILFVDLEMTTDARKIARTDTMEHTLDYAHIAAFIEQFGVENHFHLIETFAQRLSEALHTTFAAHGQVITIYKPGAVLTAQTVGVRITRGEIHGRD